MPKTVADWEDELSDLRNVVGTASDEVAYCERWLQAAQSIDERDVYVSALAEAVAEHRRLLARLADRKARYRAWLTRRIAHEEAQAVRDS